MLTVESVLCTPVPPDVEVVTVRDDESATYVTTIHGGRLDGEEFVDDRDPG